MAEALTARGLQVTGHGDGGEVTLMADLVLVVVEVRPDTTLARTAGVSPGVIGAIAVDRQMRTRPAHARCG